MKKFLLGAFCVLSIFLSSCNSGDNVVCIPSVIEAPLTGGEYYVRVDVSEHRVHWSASVDADWVRINPKSGLATYDYEDKSYITVVVKPGSEGMTNIKVMATGHNVDLPVYRMDIPEVNSNKGALPGKFSVSSSKKVNFSQGNLQYQASTETWRFATHQYDTIGYANCFRSKKYKGWIDLFYLGATGYNGKEPWMNKVNLTENNIAGTDYDWGVYCQIENGGNYNWRTPTLEEWTYILEVRTNASNLRGPAMINGINGYVLLPDGWIKPTGVHTFMADADLYSDNEYDLEQWSIMEKNGAVFFPASGSYDGYNYRTSDVNVSGNYTVSTVDFSTEPDYKSIWYYYLNGDGKVISFLSEGSLDSYADPVRLIKNAN